MKRNYHLKWYVLSYWLFRFILIRLIVSHLRNTHVNCTGANWISVSRPVITIYLSTKWKHFILYIYVWLSAFFAIFPICLHAEPLIWDLICKYLYHSELGMVYNENSTEFQFVKNWIGNIMVFILYLCKYSCI